MLPGPIFPPVSKRAGKERPAGFFGSQGGCPWGGRFQLRTTYSRFPGGLAMGGSFSVTNRVLPIPATKIVVQLKFHSGARFKCVYRFSRSPFLGGAPPLVVKQIRYGLATIHVMLIPGPFWPADWYQEAHFAHMRER